MSPLSGQLGRGLALTIPDQVFPALAMHIDASIDASGGSVSLFLLLASKAVGVLQLPLPAAAAGRSGASQRASTSSAAGGAAGILDGLAAQQQRGGASSNSSWRVVPLAADLAALGLPSALAAADGHLCISGSNGTVAALPVSALASGTGQGTVVHLHPNNLVAAMKRRMGFAACAAAVAAVPVDIPSAQHSSLLVLHADTSCHQWFVGQQRQGLSTTLLADAATRQLRPNRVLLCHNSSSGRSQQQQQQPWNVVLVLELGLADGGAQSDVRVVPLGLAAPAAQQPARPGAPTPARRLEALLPAPQQLLLEAPDASLLDARVSGSQLLLLCSTTSGGAFVAAYSTKDWSYLGRCQLLQQKGSADWGGHQVGFERRLLRAVSGTAAAISLSHARPVTDAPHMTPHPPTRPQELWSAALAAVPDAINPASHVLSQLLVPGEFCLQCAALAGVVEANRVAAAALLAVSHANRCCCPLLLL